MDRIHRLCRARGLTLGRCNPTEGLLLPGNPTRKTLERYMSLLDHYAARLLLREIIKGGDEKRWERGFKSLERFCQREVLEEYLESLRDMGVVAFISSSWPALNENIRSFGDTYEWYVAKVLERDFGSPAAWGARFTGQSSGGDHDVIAFLDGRFLYIEVKTAPPKHVESPEINAFLKRLQDISPDMAILHEDTHLRMKDKIVPMMEDGLGEYVGKRKARMERLEREIFHYRGRIFVANSKPSLSQNLEVILRYYYREAMGLFR